MEDTEQAFEPDMAELWELSDHPFETTMMNTLRALMDRVDSQYHTVLIIKTLR